MRRDEMLPILDKLISCCVPERSKRAVTELLANEKYHYIEPHHGQHILPGLWEIGQAVQEHRVLEIEYERMKKPKLVRRRMQPVGIMFSEYYFYLTAFLEDKSTFDTPDDLFPTITALTGSSPLKYWTSTFGFPIGIASRRASFARGCSLCTAADWNASCSSTPAHLLRQCWIDCLRQRLCLRMRRGGSWRRRCLEKELRCG